MAGGESRVTPGLSIRFKITSPFLTGSLLLAAAVLCLYSVSLGHNFLFDEENIILKNPLIRDLSHAGRLFRSGFFHFDAAVGQAWNQYYRPLTALSFALDYRVWGLNPLGYNFTNLLLQMAAVILLYRLAWRGCGDWGAAFVAALAWSAHPIHTEAVTYIASRGDLLAGVALLAALCAYVSGRFAVSAAVYGLALWTKESAILIPLALLAADAAFVRSRASKLLLRSLALGLVAAVYLAARYFLAGMPFLPAGGADGGTGLRLLSMGPALIRYLDALAWPQSFKFAESIRFAQAWSDPAVVQTAALAAAALAAGVLAWKRRGAWLFGTALFWLAAIPYSQAVHFYPEWAEHYLYAPSMGLAILGAAALARLRRGSGRRFWMFVVAAALAWTTLAACRTWQRNALYNDTEAYYSRLAASDSPYASYGYQNLADLAMREKQWPRAFVYLRTAEAIQPYSDVTQNYFGLCYLETGRPDLALAYFERAYEYNGRHFGYLNNAGIALTRLGRYREAVACYDRIRAAAPAYAPAYTNALVALELAGAPEEGLERCERGLLEMTGRPLESAAVLLAMTRTAYRSGDFDRALETARRIVREFPDVFWYADSARLLAGSMAPDAFTARFEREYGAYGHELAARSYLLMSHVLQGRRTELARVYDGEAAELSRPPAGENPLIRRELEIARKFLAAGSGQLISSEADTIMQSETQHTPNGDGAPTA